METVQYPRGRSIGAGIAGGIAGGAAMYGVMSGLFTMMGLGPNCFAIIMGMITGQSYEAAIGPGLAAHFGTSIVIGAIFVAVVSTKKLQITGFPKGIGLGVATGVIAYLVIFLPISMTVMPSHMIDLMKMMPMGKMAGYTQGGSMNQGQMNSSSEMNQQGAMGGGATQGKGAMDEKMKMEEMQKMLIEQTQKMIPSIMGGALASHIAYGAVLGAVATAIVRVSRK
jgi:hypothetical protein